MGLKVQKKKGKYRFWSCITDTWITEFLIIDEAKKFLIKRKKKRFKELLKREIEEEVLTFPNGWTAINGKRLK